MKYKVSVFFALLSISLSHAQIGDHSFHSGYGWPNWGAVRMDAEFKYTDKWVTTSGKKIAGSDETYGPFFLKYEKRKSDRISNAISISYSYARARYNETQLSNNSKREFSKSEYYCITRITYRKNIHLLGRKRFDPYWGWGIGLKLANYTLSGNDYISSGTMIYHLFPIALESTLGFTYSITDHFGIYGEIGPASALVRAGLFAGF